MDAFPTYASLVLLAANTAFIFFYAAAISAQIWKARKETERFSFTDVAFSLLIGLFGSTLTFLAVYLVFGKA